MRILFLSDDFPPRSFGGAGISTFELAKGVRKVGHEVFVITTCRQESEAGESDYQEGLKVYRLVSDYSERWRAYRSLYNPPVVRKLEEILKRIKPDVVHVNNIHYHLSYYSIKLAKSYAKAVVVTLRDAMSFSFGKLESPEYLKNFDARLSWFNQFRQARKRWNPLRNFFIKKYLGYADKIFTVSSALKTALEQNGIKGAEVVHTGIDLSEYPTSDKSQNKNVILFAGRLSGAKGGRVVKEVMQIISKEIHGVELVTAGADGEWLNREDMKKDYASADVVLVPSICFDAFPRVVLESMASGRPVVATCYGGAPEAVQDGVTGYIINPFDVKKMAEKVIDLLQNHGKAKKFGRAGRERVKIHFNLDDKVAKYISIYEELS